MWDWLKMIQDKIIETFWVTKLLDITGKKITPFGFRTCVVKYSDYKKVIQQTQKQATADFIKMIDEEIQFLRHCEAWLDIPVKYACELLDRVKDLELKKQMLVEKK